MNSIDTCLVSQNPSSAMNLREIINVQAVENISGNLSSDDDGRCTLIIQCLKDAHPTYLVIASRREVVSAVIV